MRYKDAMSQDGYSICMVSAIQMSINGSRWAIGCFDGAPALTVAEKPMFRACAAERNRKPA